MQLEVSLPCNIKVQSCVICVTCQPETTPAPAGSGGAEVTETGRTSTLTLRMRLQKISVLDRWWNRGGSSRASDRVGVGRDV